MVRLRTATAAILMAAAITAAAHAQSGDTIAGGDLEWKEIAPGAYFAAAHGDWEKGAHGKFVRFERGAQIPMHVHTNDYHAVIISGRMANLYEGARTEVTAGDYFYTAARRPHSHECLTDEGCLFYTYGDGLWDIEVVNAD